MAANFFIGDPTIAATTANLAQALFGDSATDKSIAQKGYYDALAGKARTEAAALARQAETQRSAAQGLAALFAGQGLSPSAAPIAPGLPGGAGEDLLPVIEGVMAGGGNAAQMSTGLQNLFATTYGAFGNEDQGRRSLVLQGKMPDADTAVTSARADQVSARNAREDLTEAEAKARIAAAATLDSARISQAGAMDRARLTPVEAVGPDGAPLFVTRGDIADARAAGGGGFTPIVTQNEAAGSAMSRTMTPEALTVFGLTGAGVDPYYDPASPTGASVGARAANVTQGRPFIDPSMYTPQAGMTPEGSPILTNRLNLATGAAAGTQPILSETEVGGMDLRSLFTPEERKRFMQTGPGVEKVADAASPTGIRNEIRMDAAGQPGIGSQTASSPPIEKATLGKEEERFRNASEALNLVKMAREVGQDATNFGAVGTLKSTIRGLVGQGSALAEGLGVKGAEIQNEIARQGLDIPLADFSEDQEVLVFLRNVLAASYARSLDPRGQLSNRDYDQAKAQFSDKLLGTQQGFNSALNTWEQILQREQAVSEQILRGSGSGLPRLMSGAPDPAPVASSQAPVASPQAPKVQRWGRDASGRPVPLE